MSAIIALLPLVLINSNPVAASMQPVTLRVTELHVAEAGEEYHAVNDKGHIAGAIVEGSEEDSRAVLWRGNEVVDLSKDAPHGEHLLAARDLNDQDDVVGTRPGTNMLREPRGFRWSRGVVTLFDDGPAVRVDSNGLVYVNGRVKQVGYDNLPRGYSYSDGGRTELLPPVTERGVALTWFRGVSAHGNAVIEAYQFHGVGESQAGFIRARQAVWLNGGALVYPKDLPPADLMAVTDEGLVAIQLHRSGQPALWQAGQLQLRMLAVLAAGETAEPHAISRDGWVVGAAATGYVFDRTSGAVVGPVRELNVGDRWRKEYAWQHHAVVWLPDGTLVDLNTLLPPNSGWNWLAEAMDISNNGHVVGYGYRDGEKRYFMMELTQ